MKELYPVIDRLNMEQEHELITVTGGVYAGEEILLTDGSVVWSSCRDPERVRSESAGDDLFCEKLTHVTRLVVCGCGFVGLSVIRLGRILGWRVLALDDRGEFTRMADKAGADEVLCGPFSQTLPSVSSDGRTCFVVVTRDHDHDRDCLECILKKPFGYVGVMGSRLRAQRMRENLHLAGFSKERTDVIHAPVGLAIGADTPEEIAVSIIAQIIQEKRSFAQGSAIPDELMRALLALSSSGTRAVLAVVTARKGSTPRDPGARMLVYPDGRTVGTIGGGSMEADVVSEAVRCLKDPDSFVPHIMAVDLTGQQSGPADMVCGGINEIFLELL